MATTTASFITPKHILVLGAGSFGTACATMFARGNPLNKVVIYDYKQSRVDEINQTHHNPSYLTEFTLPANLTATTDAEEAFVETVDFIFHAIPVQISFDYLLKIKHHINHIVEAKKATYLARTLKPLGVVKEKEVGITNLPTTPTTTTTTPPITTKITIAGMELNFARPDPIPPSNEITDPLDLQFMKPLVVISMSKGIHRESLQTMHEIFDDVFQLHALELHPPTPNANKKTANSLATIQWDKKIAPGNDLKSSMVTHLDILTDVENNVDPTISLFSPSPNDSLATATNNKNNSNIIDFKSQEESGLISPNQTEALMTTLDPLPLPTPLLSHQPSVVQTPSFLYTCYLSGPSFAKEIMMNEPTGFTVASASLPVATLVGRVISQDFTTLCSTTTDIWGVEIAGALKNVFSIGAGLIDKFQFNTKALFITRSCSEMKRIALLLYRDRVDRATFSTLAGMGDLLLSCLGPSRNRKVGMALAEGKTLAEIEQTSQELAEGVPTTKAIYTLLAKRDLVKFCPILLSIYRVLYEDLSPKDAMVYLLSLPVTEEAF